MEKSVPVESYLASPDVLSSIVKHLSRHEAEGLRFVCKAVHSTFSQCCLQFRPRLLVVASEANRLVEIDPSSGALINSVPIKKPGKRASTSQWWPTVITLCPYDQHFYVCQYMVRSTLPGSVFDRLTSCTDMHPGLLIAGQIHPPLQWTHTGIHANCNRAPCQRMLPRGPLLLQGLHVCGQVRQSA
jgi:hypothetical protein